MILGRVVGEVWAARRDPGLSGRKLLIVQPHYWYEPPFEVGHLVAVDQLGAGVGEDVVVCLGEPARQSLCSAAEAAASGAGTTPGYGRAAWLPVEAAVMAIVDSSDLQVAPNSRPLTSLVDGSAGDVGP